MQVAPCLTPQVRRGMLAACAILLSACAANPYSTVDTLERTDAQGKHRPIDLPAAMAKLSEYREDYRAKRRAEFDRQQQLSSGLFGLGALGLTLGAYGAHRDAITGVAIGGATAYQGGMWNTSPGRNAIYGAGIQALDCGAAIMAPAYAALARNETVQAWRRTLGQRTAALLAARARLAAVTVNATLSVDKRNAYMSLLDSASAESARALAVANRASDWSNLVSRAGRDLWDYTRAVNEEVERALSRTVADPNTILDQVKGLEGYLPLFGGIGGAGRSAGAFGAANRGPGAERSTQSGTGTQAGEAEVDALLLAQAALTHAVDELHVQLDGSSLRTVGPALAACRVDIAKAAPAIELSPAAIELAARVPFEQGVTVKNNVGRYNVFLKSVAPNGIKVNQTMGNTFSIVVDAKSEPGTYLVDVIDNRDASASASLTVRLVPQPQGAPPPPLANGAANRGQAGLACARGVTAAEICLVQQYLDLKPTGVAGDETCRALFAQTGKRVLEGSTRRAAKARFGLPENAGEAEIRARLGAACPGAGQPAATGQPRAVAPPAEAVASCRRLDFPERCEVPTSACLDECRLSAQAVGAMRRKLGLADPSKGFDPELRARLKERQKALGMPQTGYFSNDMKPDLGLQ